MQVIVVRIFLKICLFSKKVPAQKFKDKLHLATPH